MNIKFCVLIALVNFSCGQSEITPKELDKKEKDLEFIEKQLQIKEKDTSKLNIFKQTLPSIEISRWLKEACNINYTFSHKELNNVKFNKFENYLKSPSENLKKLLKESILVDLIKNGKNNCIIKISPYSIIFNYTYDEPGTKRTIFLLENKVFYTQFYITAAETFEYDLFTLTLKKMPYAVSSIYNETALIEKSYYDPRGVNHPNYKGHIFKNGKLNILTNKLIWLN